MKEIEYTGKLGNGTYFKISDESLSKVNKYKWRLNKQGYAVSTYRKNGKVLHLRLHRYLTECPPDLCVDHKDGDKHNYQLDNLRRCTKSQNQWNKSKVSGSSKYKGVVWINDVKKWRVNIRCYNKRYFIGLYELEEDAAKAYNIKAKELFGEFAKLNIV